MFQLHISEVALLRRDKFQNSRRNKQTNKKHSSNLDLLNKKFAILKGTLECFQFLFLK